VAGEPEVDIKDFILIGGGLLIAAVVAHGFWIAWRDRRQDLRIDIKPGIFADDRDDLDHLRSELPNGGSRPVPPRDPEQDSLDLEEPPPLLLEPTDAPPASRRVEPALGVDPAPLPELPTEPPEPAVRPEPVTVRDTAPAARPRVREVSLSDPIVAEEPKRPRRLGQRRMERPGEAEPPAPAVEELVVMNVLADPAEPYTGDAIFAALRACGLKFGEMNIFHRVEPLTKSVQYSIASAVEPGTFDMADMEAIRCPGLCLFMQLPGPEDPSAAFEDMLSVARSVVRTLGGEVKDEHRNVMTPQTVEHYRQRIVDFSRRRMSKRA
jgi:cell division protein ZipA